VLSFETLASYCLSKFGRYGSCAAEVTREIAAVLPWLHWVERVVIEHYFSSALLTDA
jgi:hypothetical protein